jgi:hypothetical protein
MKALSCRWVPHVPGPVQKAAHVEASNAMSRIFERSKTNHFYGSAVGDKSSFGSFYWCLKMLARLPAAVIPRKRQATGAMQTTITVFFTAQKLIVLDIIPKTANSTNYISLIIFSRI